MFSYISSCSDNLDHFDIEDEGGVGWDTTCMTLLAVCKVGWSSDLGLHALAELDESLVPRLDYRSVSNSELEAFLRLVLVELGSVKEFTGVAALNYVSTLNEAATRALVKFLNFKFKRV